MNDETPRPDHDDPAAVANADGGDTPGDDARVDAAVGDDSVVITAGDPGEVGAGGDAANDDGAEVSTSGTSDGGAGTSGDAEAITETEPSGDVDAGTEAEPSGDAAPDEDLEASNVDEPSRDAESAADADAEATRDAEPSRDVESDADADADATRNAEPRGDAEAGDEAAELDGFEALGLRVELTRTLSDLGYEEPTPIQQQAVPPLLQGRDLLGQAATGTGKTAAFALPIVERLEPGRRPDAPMALVLVPTRELAMQVCEAVHRYGRAFGVRAVPVYGGQPIGRQLRALENGVDVVVATPGRAVDHLNRGSLRLGEVQVVVLDEADEMLDMGFAEDLDTILGATPAERQTVLFSATLPSRLDAIARRHLRDPVRIEIGRQARTPGETPLVRQVAYVVGRAHKAAALGRVLDVEAPTAALVFCRTRTEVDQLTETLNARGYRAEALHGGMSQEQRERVLGRLRAGTAELLIATDVAARGLDVDVLTHVVNYDAPSSPETYVHRVGRVGRAGREGAAITLAEPREHRLLKNIERVTGQRLNVAKLPTVADLHARRLELTVGALRERIEAGDLDRFRPVIEHLAEDFDLVDVALAAVALSHDANGPAADEAEIPEPPARRPRPERRDDRGGRGDRFDRGERRPSRDGRPGEGRWDRGAEGRDRDRDRREDRGSGPRRRQSGEGAGTTRLFVGMGRNAGIRPQDLVGAITGETSLSGRQIGTIEIADRFSLVEVPADAADGVVAALRGSTIKGKRANIRRERF